MAVLSPALCFAVCALAPVPQEPVGSDVPRIATLHVQNAWPGRRREVVRVSVPFAPGVAKELTSFSVRGHATAWLPLTRWPDGSVQWAQAQFVAELQGGKAHDFEVVKAPGAIPPERTFATGQNLQARLAADVLYTEVEDPFGVVYQARLRPDPRAGPDGLLQATPLVRVYRYRDYHVAADPEKPGIGRDYLSLTAYLTVFHGCEHAELVVMLGNDYLGADHPGESEDPNLHPLGDVRLRRFSLVVADRELAFVPRWIRENELRPPIALVDAQDQPGGWRQDLLGPAEGLYLGDACVKAFPLVLFAPQGGRSEQPSDAEEILRRDTATAIADAPLYGLPDVEDVRRSGAFNAHGGPAPATTGVGMLAAKTAADWRSRPHFGPFGTWGDVPGTHTTGTPRNGPSGLHLAVRAGSHHLMLQAEGICLQQGLRPYHLWALEIRDDQDIYLEGLPHPVSAEQLGRNPLPEITGKYRDGLKMPYGGPHAMNAFDYEHFSVDVLYDFYCLTGAAWVREELRLLGEQLEAMLRPQKYNFSIPRRTRGEGWCMKALVLCYLATGNPAFKQFAIARLPRIQSRRGAPPDTYAVAQDPAEAVFGDGVAWDAPWQQAAYAMGMTAAWRYLGEGQFRDIAVETARYMAHQGWVEGSGPKYFLDVKDPSRFRISDNPLQGTGEFLNPAFVLAAELAKEAGLADDAALFLERAWTIFDAQAALGVDRLAANKWFQIHLDRFPSGRRAP